jgi:hypothetical protein
MDVVVKNVMWVSLRHDVVAELTDKFGLVAQAEAPVEERGVGAPHIDPLVLAFAVSVAANVVQDATKAVARLISRKRREHKELKGTLPSTVQARGPDGELIVEVPVPEDRDDGRHEDED